MGEPDKILRTLRMELDAPASPRLVLEAVELLARAVDALPTELADEAVTLVIENRGLAAELRAWNSMGVGAVETVSDILDDPGRMRATHPDLEPACVVVEQLLRPLWSYQPRFTRFKGPSVLSSERLPPATSSVSEIDAGTSTVETEVLSFGKKRPRGPESIRIQSPWGIRWVLVPPALRDRCKALASTGRIVQITMAGSWLKGKNGPEFRPEQVVSIDDSVDIMTGQDFLRAAKASGLFAADVMTSIREELKRVRD